VQQNILLSQIKESLKKKKQILYLVPELTQILSIKDTLLSNFPEIKLAILSSHISPKKYFDAWLKILSNQAQIILGTRQAIFAPLS
jgi:primosomal protein N' (replication factor Y)